MHYDQYQQTFALSALANWVGDRRGSQPALQADYQATLLQTLASADTQDRIGDWQLVWGRRSGRRPIRRCRAMPCTWRIPTPCRASARRMWSR